jgi:hypothetical protein
LPYKKLTLPELEIKPEIGKPKPLEPKVEKPEILRITPAEKEKQPVIIAKISDDPSSGGWKKILLDKDPISVTDIEKSFSESDVYSGKATAQYDNTIKAASAGQSFEISLIDVWNNSGADRTVAFRFGTGTLRFEKKIADKAGFLVNMVKTKWKGATNTAFNIYSYETSPAVSYTVFGELI